MADVEIETARDGHESSFVSTEGGRAGRHGVVIAFVSGLVPRQ